MTIAWTLFLRTRWAWARHCRCADDLGTILHLEGWLLIPFYVYIKHHFRKFHDGCSWTLFNPNQLELKLRKPLVWDRALITLNHFRDHISPLESTSLLVHFFMLFMLGLYATYYVEYILLASMQVWSTLASIFAEKFWYEADFLNFEICPFFSFRGRHFAFRTANPALDTFCT